MLKKTILAMLTFVSMVSFSHANDDIRIPNTELHYAFTSQENGVPRTTAFQGKMRLEGKIFLSWQNLDKQQPLAIDFVPNPISRKKLPYINDVYNEKIIHIQLNQMPLDKPRVVDEKANILSKHAKLPNNLTLVQPYFRDIPESFWRNKKGEISRPAQVTITNFGMEVECDSRNYYATAVAIRPLWQKSALTEPTGC